MIVVNNAHKLSYEAAEEIRRRHSAGDVSQSALAREYGVSEVNVGLIVRGRIYSRPPDTPTRETLARVAAAAPDAVATYVRSRVHNMSAASGDALNALIMSLDENNEDDVAVGDLAVAMIEGTFPASLLLREEARRLHAGGMSIGSVAARLGYSRRHIQVILDDDRIRRRREKQLIRRSRRYRES